MRGRIFLVLLLTYRCIFITRHDAINFLKLHIPLNKYHVIKLSEDSKFYQINIISTRKHAQHIKLLGAMDEWF